MSNLPIPDYHQILDSLSQGLFVVDREFRVVLWNRWLEQHSHLKAEDAIGRKITDLFPDLERKGFGWKVESVFRLGNFAFFSQRLHHYLLPFPSTGYVLSELEFMQQNVILSPLRDESGEVNLVAVSIQDNTEAVLYQGRLEQAYAKLEKASQTDPLTGLANRRHLFNRLAEEIKRHSRTGAPLSVAMLDLDHFKRINDTYGHMVGDEVLVHLARLAQEHLRTYDFIGRYGGEEFTLVLPETPLEAAAIVVDRLRQKVESTSLETAGTSIRITFSAGVASTEGRPHLTPDLFLDLADSELYRAKQGGRNTVYKARP